MVDTLFSVEGKVAIVTGALGQLGTQFANELLKRGAKVAVFTRTIREASIKELYTEEDRGKANVTFHTVDITKKKTIQKAVNEVVEKWGVPHILINNAGIDTQPSVPPEVSGPFLLRPNLGQEEVKRSEKSCPRYARCVRWTYGKKEENVHW